jgi:hypothetical protein
MTAPFALSTKSVLKTALRGALLACLLVAWPLEALAVSKAVKVACMGDYFANCSQHRVGTRELRQCMRAAGPRLSKRCINALVVAGEVSKSELKRRSAALH